MRVALVVLASVGIALLTGGLLAFVFGGWVLHGSLVVSGLGPLNGRWSQADYCFLGAILAAIGGGLATCGFAGLRNRTRL